jgi:hypothetical protein
MEDYAIYLDMDGVVADYDAGIRALGFEPDPKKKNALNRSGSNDPFKRTMYDAIKGTEFYRNLPFQAGALELYAAIATAKPIILTASPKFGASEDDYFLNPYWLGASYHKRTWIEEHLLPHAQVRHHLKGTDGSKIAVLNDRIPIADERFICTTSSRKQEFIGRKHSDHQILIDDRRDNCVRWARAGGTAIMHTSAGETIGMLDAYREGGAALKAVFTIVPFGGMVGGLNDARTWAELEAAADGNP